MLHQVQEGTRIQITSSYWVHNELCWHQKINEVIIMDRITILIVLRLLYRWSLGKDEHQRRQQCHGLVSLSLHRVHSAIHEIPPATCYNSSKFVRKRHTSYNNISFSLALILSWNVCVAL